MKRTGMNQIPGLRRWKRDKKRLWLILLLMSLSFLTAETTFLFGDSLEAALAEQRKNAYGEWQAAFTIKDPSDEALVTGNPFFARMGRVRTVGEIPGGPEHASVKIGAMDETAAELARLTLTEGRLPEAEGEAAVEASELSWLGGKAVGDMVTFSVEAGGQKTEMTVTLCGILADYTANWSISDSVDLPGILFAEEALEGFAGDGSDARTLLLTVGESSWKTMQQDVEEIQITGRCYWNDYTYPEEASTVSQALALLRAAGGILCAVVLFTAVWFSVKSRNEEWTVLALLGATAGRLRWLMLREAAVFGVCSATAGSAASLAIFVLAKPVLSRMAGGAAVPMVFSRKSFLTALAIGAATVAVSWLLPILRVRSLSADAPRTQRKIRRLRAGRTGKLTPFRMWLRHFTGRPVYTAAKFFVMLGLFLVPCLALHLIEESQGQMRARETYYGNSYTWEQEDPGGEVGADEEAVEKLSLIYGVERVTAYRQRDAVEDFYTTDSLLANEEYLAIYREKLLIQVESEISSAQEIADTVDDDGKILAEIRAWQEKKSRIEEGAFPIQILATDATWILEAWAAEADVGSCDAEAVKEGREAILVFPPYVGHEFEDGVEYNCGLEREVQTGEHMVSFGDEKKITELVVSYEGESHSAAVGGIVTAVDDDALTKWDRPSAPTLICSEAFLDQFEGDTGTRYQRIRCELTDYAGAAADKLAVKALRAARGLEFTNHRTEILSLREEFLTTAGFAGVISVLIFILLALIFAGMTAGERQSGTERNRILSDLGMKKSWRRISRLSENGALIVLAEAAGTIFLSLYYTWQDNRRFAESGGGTEALAFRVGLDPGHFLAIAVIVCVLCLLLTMRKENGEKVREE